MIVNVLDSKGVSAVLSDVMRNTANFDDNPYSTVPTLSPEQAAALAKSELANSNNISEANLALTGKPELVIYDPMVVSGVPGLSVLAWKVVVAASYFGGPAEELYVDAKSGTIALRIPLAHTAKYRQAYDSNNNWWNFWGTLVRSEGQMPCGIADADTLYTQLGRAYDYFLAIHGRDGIDNNGSNIQATARFTWEICCWCPNAIWYGPQDRMGFCPGMVTEDIVSHEYAHGVTKYTSGLLYTGESGAINESMSDIWGEFIDLSFGPDNASDDWLIGEGCALGILRDMDEPHTYGDPEVYQEPGYWYNGFFDTVFVHTNSAVGNKLCHLLVAGDSNFRGDSFLVDGLGLHDAPKSDKFQQEA